MFLKNKLIFLFSSIVMLIGSIYFSYFIFDPNQYQSSEQFLVERSKVHKATVVHCEKTVYNYKCYYQFMYKKTYFTGYSFVNRAINVNELVDIEVIIKNPVYSRIKNSDFFIFPISYLYASIVIAIVSLCVFLVTSIALFFAFKYKNNK